MRMTSFYSFEELKELGFKYLGGEDILISRKTSIYGADHISVGNHTRIDDFSLLSGNIFIGEHVHIAAYCGLFGGSSGIVIEDFCGISSRSAVYADTDDYSGEAMTNPTIPDEYRHILGGCVTFKKHSLIGTGCTVLSNLTVGEGASVGAMSLIQKDIEPWTVNAGIPCRKLKERSRRLLELEKKMKR